MHAVKSNLVKPDSPVDLLHVTLLFGDHLQFMVHLFEPLGVIGTLRSAVLLKEHVFELLCCVYLSSAVLLLLN